MSKIFSKLTFLVIALLVIIVTVLDLCRFSQLATSSYENPWFSNSISQPYTTFRLSLVSEDHKREYWTQNSIGSERLKIREIAVNDVVFWTIIERHPI